jgi:hypothetical protein
MYGHIYIRKTEMDGDLGKMILGNILDGYHIINIMPVKILRRSADSNVSGYLENYYEIGIIDTEAVDETIGTIPTPTKGGD